MYTKETLLNRISDMMESELSYIYDEEGIKSGDISPLQYLEWQRLTNEITSLFLELIEQNK